MRELPTRTSGVVSVRPLDRGQPSSGQAPRASATAAGSGQDASATRRPLKLLRFPAVRERTGLVALDDLASGAARRVPEAPPDLAECCGVG